MGRIPRPLSRRPRQLRRGLLGSPPDLFPSAVRLQCGIALNPTTVDGDLAAVDPPCGDTDLEDANEELSERLAVNLAKVTDGAEVRLLVRAQVPEGDVPLQQSVQLTGAPDPDAVPEDEDPQQLTGW